MKVRLKRDVTQEECHWLERDFKEGEEVFTYGGATYGCISEGGTACTLVEDETLFFQLPHAALDSGIPEEPLDENLPYVGVEKLSNDMEQEFHPNGISEGYKRGGSMMQRPTVGRSFLLERNMGYFETSKVTEILEETETGGKFKTRNSTYAWAVITDRENYQHGNVTADQG